MIIALSLICTAWILVTYGIKITINRKEDITVSHITETEKSEPIEYTKPEDVVPVDKDPVGIIFAAQESAMQQIDEALLGEGIIDE